MRTASLRVLRRVLADQNLPDAMDMLTQKPAKTKSNAEFLMSVSLK
jgi:transcription termination factor Rho